jgi:hypothetical protein
VQAQILKSRIFLNFYMLFFFCVTFYSKCTKAQTLAAGRRYGVGTYASDHDLAPCTHAFMAKHPRCCTGTPELAINTKLGICIFMYVYGCMGICPLHKYVCMYVCIYVHTYVHTYIHTYILMQRTN